MQIQSDLMSAEYIDMADNFHVNPDSCENTDHYDSYLVQTSLMDMKTGMGVTHLFVDVENEKNPVIAGYISLRASSLIKEMGETHKFGSPALEIAELAVAKEYERSGIGKDMVKYAISIADELNNSLMSCMYILVCADPDAVEFYRHIGFKNIRDYVEAVPREHWNLNCVPMLMRITEV